MTNGTQVAGRIWCSRGPGGFRKVMFRMLALWALMVLPRQISNKGIRGNDQRSHITSWTLSLSPSTLFFPYLITSKTAPTPRCSLRPTTYLVLGVNWDNCVVWHWATTMPVQLFVLWGNRLVHTFRRDFCREKCAGNVSQHSTMAVVPEGAQSSWIRCVEFQQQILL